MSKQSFKPITLKRIIETCSLAINSRGITPHSLEKNLSVSKRRAKEILSEMTKMKLLIKANEVFKASLDAIKIIDAFNQENWLIIHEILYKNYEFYQTFIDTLKKYGSKGKGLTREELLLILRKGKLKFNVVMLDVLSDWAERLGIVQHNLYEGRYYYVDDQKTKDEHFMSILKECYSELNKQVKPGVKLIYIEIPRIREYVCEKMGISREKFDKLLILAYISNPDKIELSGAPLISATKNIPESIRKMKGGKKEDILSPYFYRIKEGKGIEISGKVYQFIAIFGG